METGNVTTPFGRRTMTLGMLASQAVAQTIAPEASVDKWKLYRALCIARARLGVSDRALSVLNALMSFHPKPELSAGDALVVFPSNAHLSLRTHGMAETTLRRHLAALVEAGLILRKDSPNGKRYARKDGQGAIDEAFGFSLAPLLARAEEIERLAAEVTADRLLLQRMKERLTLVRRDITKLIATALEEALAGDWMAIEAEYRRLSLSLPRIPSLETLASAVDAMEVLRAEIVKQMENQLNFEKTDGNATRNDRHIHNSNNINPSDLEPRFETKQGGTAESSPQPMDADDAVLGRTLKDEAMPPMLSRSSGGREKSSSTAADVGRKPYPLALVLQACPEISLYGPGGAVGNWRDLMSAAVVVRSMLGVSPSAYEEACAVLGPENAATVMACILERAGHITSAGGYLRDLTRRADRGEFSLGPMLMALLRARGLPERCVG